MIEHVLDRDLPPELYCLLATDMLFSDGLSGCFARTGCALGVLLDVLALVDELVRATAGEAALGGGAQLVRDARNGACRSCGEHREGFRVVVVDNWSGKINRGYLRSFPNKLWAGCCSLLPEV